MKKLREKDYYREKIIELVKKIKNQNILKYIYIIVSDIVKEDNKNEQQT